MREPLAIALVFAALSVACGDPAAPQTPIAGKPRVPQAPPGEQRGEVRLADTKQLTFGGENAEAYFSFKGDQLIFQSRKPTEGCDRISRMFLDAPQKQIPVSSGKGATTCSYFLPGDQQVVYASTHLAGDNCPKRPDMSQGYVWAIYDSYDIFKANADGSGVTRLTDSPGYDAEATTCAKDGTILFTSVRNGDLDLYRMDKDGQNVKQLTHLPGYDGGAFFNHDCTKIVWRSSRPKGPALEEYQALLKQGLVRPSKLEIWVANADGSEPVQITYLNAASFAPYFVPGDKRVIFSSNVSDPQGREFELYAIDIDGTNLERITFSPGFDGFPMFSPDGTKLVFASNRATPEGQSDTNVFLARWMGGEARTLSGPADRLARDARYLAANEREGRGIGSKGLAESATFIEERFRKLGLSPAGTRGFRQPFEVKTKLSGDASLEVDGKPIDGAVPLSFSLPNAPKLLAPLVLAGYGVVGDGVDDYRGLDVKDKAVVVRRFVPAKISERSAVRRHGDLRRKAQLARERGAKALIVVDDPSPPLGAAAAGWKKPSEATQPKLSVGGSADVGILALSVPRGAFAPVLARLEKRTRTTAKVGVALTSETSLADNVIGRIASEAPADQRLPGIVLIGAHYDHLGHGGHGSMQPDSQAVHPGADDNASGTAALLELASQLSQKSKTLRRDVWLVAFSGEERGVLGSNHFVKEPPNGLKIENVVSMLNLDMVGRMRKSQLEVLGHGTSKAFDPLLRAECDKTRIDCKLGDAGGHGPSDHAPFYASKVPVLFFFTGTHEDYHRPSDTADRLNFAGLVRTTELTDRVATAIANTAERPDYVEVATPLPLGDMRQRGASLGSIPDYAGPAGGKSGVLLAGVRPGGAADLAGLQRGDIVTKIGSIEIRNVEDLMFALGEHAPNEKAKISFVRDNKTMSASVTFQGRQAH